MNIKEVADILSVSVRTVRRYSKTGKLKVVYVKGIGQYDKTEVSSLKCHLEERKPIRVNKSENKEEPLSKCLEAIALFYHVSQLRQKILLTVDEAVLVSGLSSSEIKRAIKEKKIIAMKDGGVWKIPMPYFRNYIMTLVGAEFPHPLATSRGRACTEHPTGE